MRENQTNYIRWFHEISMRDIALVGGKNASLGELTKALQSSQIQVPIGFAITTAAYALIIHRANIGDQIHNLLEKIDFKNISNLSEIATEIRELIFEAGMPLELECQIIEAYQSLSTKLGEKNLDVALRSSATAEDLPTASFAGQLVSFLNVRGNEELLKACSHCFASLFTDRAISYRENHGFDHKKVYVSVGVQQMVRSDLGSSGVMFTLDTESGARNVIVINSSFGLGENIVAGRVDPDEFVVVKSLVGSGKAPIIKRKLGAKQFRMVYSKDKQERTKNEKVSTIDQLKYSLSDDEALQLAACAIEIETHYSNIRNCDTPLDIEWAKDREKLYIVQVRPETVHSAEIEFIGRNYVFDKKSEVLLKGVAVGNSVGKGKCRIIHGASDLEQFSKGEILVSQMTNPDWVPVMKKAAAIITDHGGRTCHAAIVSRELGVPCIVGTGNATTQLENNHEVTVSCAEGEIGFVYRGLLQFEEHKIAWNAVEKPKTKIMLNLGNPAHALKLSRLPVDGVGLVRLEFIISEMARVHPLALLNLDLLKSDKVRENIQAILLQHNENPDEYFVNRLMDGIGMIAGAFYPRPVIVRFSDFKTNEYAGLIGGEEFEPREENPMIGFRGAARYCHARYRKAFDLECRAVKRLREEVGLMNIIAMVPFCRSPKEGEDVILEMNKNGLKRGVEEFKLYVMSELPVNVFRAGEFAKLFDGFSIGSNDLTQMILGVDRDSELVRHLFDERDPAVLQAIQILITSARNANIPIGICGQAPSDYPEFSEFLVEQQIDSISVSPDALLTTMKTVLQHERYLKSKVENRKAV